MQGQKQSRVDNLEKRMAAAVKVIQALINETENLKTMVFGQQELLKQFKEYNKALEKLKNINEEMQQVSEGEAKLEVPE